jgi:hypothetical protein
MGGLPSMSRLFASSISANKVLALTPAMRRLGWSKVLRCLLKSQSPRPPPSAGEGSRDRARLSAIQAGSRSPVLVQTSERNSTRRGSRPLITSSTKLNGCKIGNDSCEPGSCKVEFAQLRLMPLRNLAQGRSYLSRQKQAAAESRDSVPSFRRSVAQQELDLLKLSSGNVAHRAQGRRRSWEAHLSIPAS